MSSKFNTALTHTTGLYDKIEILLKKRLLSDPENVSLLWQFAENSRQQGQLDIAKHYSLQVLKLQPDHQPALHLYNILHEIKSSTFLADNQPVPFIRRMNFLHWPQQKELWAHSQKHRSDFAPSNVIFGPSDTRKSEVVNPSRKIRSWFIPKILDLVQKKSDFLHLSNLEVGKNELQFTRHGNHHYFEVHNDATYPGETKKSAALEKAKLRQVSFIYYFHTIPRQFKGGDLLLFDTDIENNSWHFKHTRISPTHNSLVLFPSQFYHQVTPVHLEPDEFMHGRFTLNGWIHSKA
jgi:Rps23 Pro-64 3,4-dihydroxylase Tpa1-like proline 4-hydroxylase